MEAMGLDNRKPTSEELTRMCDIARREMEVGAYGLSTGLIYMPCAYAETSELIDLCKVIADFDGAFVKTSAPTVCSVASHTRGSSDRFLASWASTFVRRRPLPSKMQSAR
jgi:N-acyl-D-aspartate/D-glutamate deacylase